MKRNFITLSGLILLFHLCACNNSNSVIPAQQVVRVVPEVKSIFINGDSIHYIDIGKGEPVVFVHGAFGDYRTWDAQIDTFSQHYRVISYSKRMSWPNNQIADASTDVSTTGHAQDLAEFIKALNLAPVHLIGHSGGAVVSLSATIAHPELVRSLVLGEAPVSSLLKNVAGGDTIGNSLFLSAIKPATEAFNNNEEERGLKAFVNGVNPDSTYFDNLSQQMREHMKANIPEVKHNLLHGRPEKEITCDDIAKIKIPVLILTGSKSIPFFSAVNDELYRCLPNRERATIINSTHGLEFDNPAEFNSIVLEFLARHSK